MFLIVDGASGVDWELGTAQLIYARQHLKADMTGE